MCIEDEKAGFFEHSDCFEKPLIEAPLFSYFESWRTSLDATYKGTFSDLIYGDLPTMDEVEDALKFLKENLK